MSTVREATDEETDRAAVDLVMILGSVEHARIHITACITTVRTLARRDIISASDAIKLENEYERLAVRISARSDGKRL